jgi:hypothetical protein
MKLKRIATDVAHACRIIGMQWRLRNKLPLAG